MLAAHPKAGGRTLLVGDPCFDEHVGSRPRRNAYREVLGVAEHQPEDRAASLLRRIFHRGR